MGPDHVSALFADGQGGFRFARWSRPIVPVVFGVDDNTLAIVKGALVAVVKLAGHHISDTDPEMGANLMIFFLRDWEELRDIPDLEGLIPELAELLPKLQAQSANQYRLFRFESDGSIRAAFVFLRMDEALAGMAAEDLALTQAARVILLWGPGAFADQSPLVFANTIGVLRPDIAGVIKVAYLPELPAASTDGSLALRLSARLGLLAPELSGSSGETGDAVNGPGPAQ